MSQQNNQAINQPQNPHYDDEIDLFELAADLWQQKLLIIAVTAITTLLGLGYLFVAKPTYQVEVVVLPPTLIETQALATQTLVEYNPQQVFDLYKNEFMSIQSQKEFFPQLFEKNISLESLSKIFSIQTAAKNSPTQHVKFKYISDDSANSAEQLNQYLAFVENKVKENINSEFNLVKTSRAQNFEKEINTIIKHLTEQRVEEILVLKEALEIAEQAGIHDFANDKVAGKDLPEYMKGTRLLKAEIKALENRQTEVWSDRKVIDLKQKLSMLEAETLDLTNFKSVIVEQEAVQPKSAIKPKKKLILAVAFVLGGMLGVFAALLRSAIRKRRQAV